MQSSGSGRRAIGYLTVCRDDRERFWGGMLSIDRVGRPLEFHSTVPVVASRAHTILYGQTLPRHVYGELIAPALLQRVKARPLAVLTDCLEVLPVRRQSAYPIICVSAERAEPSNVDSPTGVSSVEGDAIPGTGMVNVDACPGFGEGCDIGQIDGVRGGVPHMGGSAWLEDTPVSGVRACVLAGYESDAGVLAQVWPSFGGHVDLMEPLVRIREALSEAQQAA